MKTFKHPIAFFLLLFVSLSISAQDFEVPKNYTLKTDKDYKKYETDIANCIHWLENTPISVDKQKRIEANSFLVQWLTGSPTVTIEVSSYVVELTDKNPELLVAFMGGWTKYAMENPVKTDPFYGNFAGLKSILKVYKMNKDNGIKKNKTVEKLLKLETEDDLLLWLKKTLSS